MTWTERATLFSMLAVFCTLTPLVSGARKDLLDRLPEAERAVADREVRRNLEPTLLDVDEKLAPALCVLTYPGLEADEFFLALGCCADQHQHAFGGFFHSGLQVDPVRPHIHVSPRQRSRSCQAS